MVKILSMLKFTSGLTKIRSGRTKLAKSSWSYQEDLYLQRGRVKHLKKLQMRLWMLLKYRLPSISKRKEESDNFIYKIIQIYFDLSLIHISEPTRPY